MSEVKLFSGTNSIQLAEKIAKHYGKRLGDLTLSKFSDGEMSPSYNESIRGCTVFLIQTTNPTADNLLELCLMIDAAKRASAYKVCAVIPYYGYARQDRKDRPRVSIAAKLIANMLTSAGADRIMTCDLHAGQIQGFFDIPTDNLYGAPVMSADILERHGDKNITVVSPDVGGVVRARALAKRLDDAPLAIVDKRREKAGVSEVMNIIGDVKDRFCILIDDIADSAGTLCNAADALKAAGAHSVVRELFAGALEAATEALHALGYSDGQAMQKAETFKQHDENLLNKQAKVMEILETFMALKKVIQCKAITSPEINNKIISFLDKLKLVFR